MKKIISILALALCVLLTSCSSGFETVEEQVEVVDKYTAVESQYHYFGLNKGWESYTAYYLVLENGEVEEVDRGDYAKYQVGDLYTYTYKKAVNDNGN